MNRDLNTRIIDLTVGELLELLNGQKREPVERIEYTDKFVHQISGIAKLLGVSKTMVHKYRKNGWIEPAIKQSGRKIICDASLALQLFGEQKNN
jgi:hypothetical protein